jgi:DNA-binding response OmpR family regulator
MERRIDSDRRHVPRGGRRAFDREGTYPPILVAESYDSVRKACSRYLQQFHFDVTEAADGEQALAKIVVGRPQVILAEWNLPAMTAGRLAEWVARRPLGNVPVIILANAAEDDVVPPRAAGVLRKPFALSEMLEEVRRVLRAGAA